MAPVEIDIGVEEMRLEPRHEAADRRAQPQVRHPVDGSTAERIAGTVATDPHGVDTEGRLQIVVEAEIGGRNTDRPAAPVTDRDTAVDLPEPAEKRGRLARSAG